VRVDPRLPLLDGREVEQIALSSAWADADLNRLGEDWVAVHVFEVVNRSAFQSGVVDNADLRPYSRAEVARLPSLLPKTQEQYWEEDFTLLQRFVAREGHADVPADHLEEGQPIANWVANMKYQRAWGSLRPEWERRLEALPGWRWLSGDDFFLLARFAVEHGHARVPPDYIDEGRPIGQWVQELRKTHAMGMLSPGWILRLEKIPGWGMVASAPI